MKALVLICAGIFLLVLIYLLNGAGDRSEVLLRSAKTNEAQPVEAATTGPIDAAEPESKTTNRDREPDEMSPDMATVLDEPGLSYSLASEEPRLETIHVPPDEEDTQETIDSSKLDDASRWIPRDWSLGSPSVTASVGLFYQLESDFETVLNGNASVSIKSVQPVEPQWTAGIGQIVDAETFRGQRLKYSGFLRTRRLGLENATSAMLWIRADDETGRVVAFQNTIGQFVSQDAEWSESTIVIDIPMTASAIFYGASLIGGGSAWVDSLSLEPVDLTYPITSLPYDKQTFNRVPNPEWVLTMPGNLGFELVIPRPEP